MMKTDELLLHIGHGKTGTTTLQRTLARAHETLAHEGVHFVKPVPYSGNAALLAYELFQHQSFGHFQTRYFAKTLPQIRDMSLQAWQEVCQTVAQDSPRKVLISSEMLFRPMTSAVIRAANEKIDAIAHSSRIVTYLRAPDGYYLSGLQQALKKLRPTSPNSRTPLKDTVEPLIRNWNGKVDLNVFDRDALKDRDSFIDFMSKYLPEIDLATVPRRAETLNTSLSAEAMSLLYEFASDRTRWPRDAYPLKSEIARADGRVANPTKPKLYPHIREMVLNWNAPDLFWLRDTHGITFPNIDYDALNPSEIDLDALTVGKIENICDVNQDRKAELLRHAIWRARLPVQMRRWLAKY